MFWRVSVAILALTYFHGADNVARDGGQIAANLRSEAPRAAVNFCLDKPELCRKTLTQAAGLTAPGDAHFSSKAKAKPQPEAKPEIEAKAEIEAGPQPVASGEFPLPPTRPHSLATRKGA